MNITYFLALCSFLFLVTENTCVAEEGQSNVSPLSAQQIKEQEQGQALLNKIVMGQPRFSLVGTLEQDPSGAYSINGEVIQINSATRIEGSLVVGLPVSTHGFIENGKMVARVIHVGSPSTSAAVSAGNPERESALDIERKK